MEVILVLPGSTEYARQGRVQGSLDIPLSEQGESEVVDLAKQLVDRNIEGIYYSNCARARQTAETLRDQLNVKCKRLDKMENLDHGLWQGMLTEEIRRKQPKVYRQWQDQPDTICPPEGETIINARGRVGGALKRLAKKHKSGTIAIVVPEPLASLVRECATHCELGDLWQAEQSHGTWEAISFSTQHNVPTT